MPNEISWTAPEYVHYPKSVWWFAAATVIAAGLIGWFVYQKDLFTALLFLLLYILVLFFARSKPRKVKITLTSTVLRIGGMTVPYMQIKNFWLVYHPPEVKTLNFETTAYLNKFITVQLENTNPVQVRQFLLQYIPEDLEKEEQTSDKIARTFRF